MKYRCSNQQGPCLGSTVNLAMPKIDLLGTTVMTRCPDHAAQLMTDAVSFPLQLAYLAAAEWIVVPPATQRFAVGLAHSQSFAAVA